MERQKQLRRIAIDAGFWDIKAFPGGQLTQCLTIPNAIGDIKSHNLPVDTDFQFMSASGVDGSFSVGNYAVKFGGLATNRQDRTWYQSSNFLKVFYAAMSAAGVQDGDDLEIVVCIPIADKSQSHAIRQLLQRDFCFHLRGGQPVSFKVSAVFVTLQGISAFFHFILDINGEIRLDPRGKETYLLECGGNTLHEVRFSDLVDLEEATQTHYNMGFWQVVYEVDEYLRQEHGANLSLIQVAQACHAGRIFLDGDVDLSEIVNDLSFSLAKKHADLVSQRNLKSVDFLRVAGGTGLRFFEVYKTLNPRFELLPNPTFANVVGAWKFSKM